MLGWDAGRRRSCEGTRHSIVHSACAGPRHAIAALPHPLPRARASMGPPPPSHMFDVWKDDAARTATDQENGEFDWTGKRRTGA